MKASSWEALAQKLLGSSGLSVSTPLLLCQCAIPRGPHASFQREGPITCYSWNMTSRAFVLGGPQGVGQDRGGSMQFSKLCGIIIRVSSNVSYSLWSIDNEEGGIRRPKAYLPLIMHIAEKTDRIEMVHPILMVLAQFWRFDTSLSIRENRLHPLTVFWGGRKCSQSV